LFKKTYYTPKENYAFVLCHVLFY